MATISERKTERGGLRYQVKVCLKGYPPQGATFRRKKDALLWAQTTKQRSPWGLSMKQQAHPHIAIDGRGTWNTTAAVGVRIWTA